MTRLVCSTLAITLLCSSFVSGNAFAQNQTQVQPDQKTPEKELAKRLEVQGLRLLIATKILDDKMPTLMGLPKEVWWAGSSSNLGGWSVVIAGAVATIGALAAFSEVADSADTAPVASFASLVLGAASVGLFDSAGGSFDHARAESNQAAETAYAKIQHDIGQAADQTASQMSSIFSLSVQEQLVLKQALIDDAAKQFEANSNILAGNKTGIQVDALETMYRYKLISADSYGAAKEIRGILENTEKRKKTISVRVSLIRGEKQFQNMVDYLKGINQKIDDRELNVHLSKVLAETEMELAFIKAEANKK